ncbi:glycosyltransferase [Crossiella cryophila]|uniref:UDP:flavonoid glycosyltransferase YjiC (YdhE family) n=1 Tax=Crossiella cryophila TaxID=43355 RepID=A0A7W7CFC7_9PSEU|nr:glycosyltransferase [Crossiella cryophila]MBB4678738.1 UDP:flavonoid glycosyltransferase YjiC (YdhE family) [Crossiella cryophila]
MRLLFAAMAAHGHTYPLVPLAQAAIRAGHDVVFAAGAPFLPVLHAAGLPAVPAGMGLPEALAAATAAGVQAGDRQVGHALGQVMARQWAEDLAVLLARHRTELLIHDVTTLGAALAGAQAGIPVLAHTFGRVDPGPTWKMINWVFTELVEDAGLDAATVLHSGRVLDICPESVQAPGFLATADRIPLRPVGWSPPGAPPPVRRRPLVYLTLGTAFATPELLRQSLFGLATLPVDVLVTTGPTVPAAALGEVPGNVRVESWVAQQDLLPRADLVVHHGGSGTMLGAFQAGLPQLLLPRAADQFGNAEAVVTAGAGARLLPDDVTSEAVTTLAEALLADPGPRAAARRIAAEIAAMPSPDRVVAELTG